jgi:hypothetical protein
MPTQESPWPRCDKCGHEIASDTDRCQCLPPDLEAIRERLDRPTTPSWALYITSDAGRADLRAYLQAFDAQAARLAAVEEAARAVVNNQSGSTWAAITDLAVVLDGAATEETRDG